MLDIGKLYEKAGKYLQKQKFESAAVVFPDTDLAQAGLASYRVEGRGFSPAACSG
jgi:hypothetical protein